jgi:hypothetical protein
MRYDGISPSRKKVNGMNRAQREPQGHSTKNTRKERKGNDRYPRKRRIAYRPIRARDDISYFLLGWRFYLLLLRKALHGGNAQRDIDLFFGLFIDWRPKDRYQIIGEFGDLGFCEIPTYDMILFKKNRSMKNEA